MKSSRNRICKHIRNLCLSFLLFFKRQLRARKWISPCLESKFDSQSPGKNDSQDGTHVCIPGRNVHSAGSLRLDDCQSSLFGETNTMKETLSQKRWTVFPRTIPKTDLCPLACGLPPPTQFKYIYKK